MKLYFLLAGCYIPFAICMLNGEHYLMLMMHNNHKTVKTGKRILTFIILVRRYLPYALTPYLCVSVSSPTTSQPFAPRDNSTYTSSVIFFYLS